MTRAEPVPQLPPPVGTEPFLVDFDTRVDRLDGEVVVTVLGEIDMASGSLLWECLAAVIPDVGQRLVIDLSETTFIDSTGIAIFARTQKRLGPGGAQLVLRAPNTSARRVLRITGIDAIITVEDGGGAPVRANRADGESPPPPAA